MLLRSVRDLKRSRKARGQFDFIKCRLVNRMDNYFEFENEAGLINGMIE